MKSYQKNKNEMYNIRYYILLLMIFGTNVSQFSTFWNDSHNFFIVVTNCLSSRPKILNSCNKYVQSGQNDPKKHPHFS